MAVDIKLFALFLKKKKMEEGGKKTEQNRSLLI